MAIVRNDGKKPEIENVNRGAADKEAAVFMGNGKSRSSLWRDVNILSYSWGQGFTIQARFGS